MLEVARDVVKSKTMIGVLVFMILISYLSATQNKSLKSNENSLYTISSVK